MWSKSSPLMDCDSISIFPFFISTAKAMKKDSTNPYYYLFDAFLLIILITAILLLISIRCLAYRLQFY